MARKFGVSTDALNLRAAPGGGGTILAVLLEGELLVELDAAAQLLDDGTTWLNVRAESGLEGWLHAGFVTEIEPPPPAKYRVTTAALNLRAGPGTDHTILEVVHDSDILTEIGDSATDAGGDAWHNVAAPSGTNGWVSATYVARVMDAAGGGSTGSGALAWGKIVGPEFCARARELAANIGCEPDFLMAAIAFETGRRFTSDVRNQWSGATGLIQFMPATARGLGTTVEALARMSAVEQLTLVERYLEPYAGRIETIEDLYMSILWPAAIGKPNDYPLFVRGTIQYTQNAGLDANNDGIVTKQEAARPVIDHLSQGRHPDNCG